MLDTDTKRRIDNARDILVGKVPDPKSQVEQITIALIYKFMDDMDAESEELGGKRKFFTGGFARYGWAKLLRSGLSGHETLALYAEAISKMPENPGLPELFRDIFKNAYLPYRDPETLKAFLKIIDEFTYDHSEKLGDAFEYLLSVLGSQGDAGQFRTPRHIIDFMVEIVDPKKDEKILDPACGTAGLLVSAYKYIKLQNSSESQRQQAEALKAQKTPEDRIHTSSLNGASGDLLTPDDRAALARNIQGYDISPDMVRLSLVNLYLHGFNDPHIYEYDTLTSEERWNEFADVILANPPFMSPKGGIKPHQRFSIQSKRSEVLFVDYMADHLTPGGRAAIIVPEGIIFQSQNAYKDLRRKLIDECLVAVVSLPAGCFNPYSGVKTSILIFDKSLAKHSPTLGFFKVENDGFGLGAQRRPIDKNDLPQVKRELQAYLEALRAREATEELELRHGLVVEKARVTEGGECNLSGERYADVISAAHNFESVKLGDERYFRIESGGTPKSGEEAYWDGPIPWATLVDLPPRDFISEIRETKRTITEKGLKESSAKLIPANSVIVSTRATIGRIGINRVPIATNQGFKNIVVQDQSEAISEYVALAVTRLVPTMDAWATGGTFKEISKSKFSELEIPLPPLPLQKEIVAEIEGYQKVIDGARAVLDHYRPHIPIHPDWPIVELGEVCSTSSGGTPLSGDKAYYEGGTIPWLRSGEVAQGEVRHSELFITKEGLKNSSAKMFPIDTVLVAMYGATAGEVGILRFEAATNQAVCGIIPKEQLLPDFLYLFLKADKSSLVRLAGGGAQPNISQKIVRQFKIPLPPLETQQAIVAEIEAEQALVQANHELIERMEKKIEATLARVWGEAPETVVTEIAGDSGELLAAEDASPYASASR